MRSLITRPTLIARFIFYPILIILQKRRKAYVLAFSIIAILSSCYHSFYRTNTSSSIDSNKVAQLKSERKYFIIHFSDSTKGLEQVNIKNDSLFGTIVSLPAGHAKYLFPDSGSVRNRVKASDKNGALVEVHLYTTQSHANTGGNFSANTSSFNRVDVYELNKSATTTNYVVSTAVIVVPVILLIMGAMCTDCGPYGH